MINQKDISVRGKSLDLRGKCLIFEKIHATPWSKYQSGYSSSLACRTKVLVTKQYLGQSTFQLDHPDSGCHWTSIVWQNFCLMILPRITALDENFTCWGTSVLKQFAGNFTSVLFGRFVSQKSPLTLIIIFWRLITQLLSRKLCDFLRVCHFKKMVRIINVKGMYPTLENIYTLNKFLADKLYLVFHEIHMPCG